MFHWLRGQYQIPNKTSIQYRDKHVSTAANLTISVSTKHSSTTKPLLLFHIKRSSPTLPSRNLTCPKEQKARGLQNIHEILFVNRGHIILQVELGTPVSTKPHHPRCLCLASKDLDPCEVSLQGTVELMKYVAVSVASATTIKSVPDGAA